MYSCRAVLSIPYSMVLPNQISIFVTKLIDEFLYAYHSIIHYVCGILIEKVSTHQNIA